MFTLKQIAEAEEEMLEHTIGKTGGMLTYDQLTRLEIELNVKAMSIAEVLAINGVRPFIVLRPAGSHLDINMMWETTQPRYST